MSGNRIGLRRLFDPKGCVLANREELTVDLTVSSRYEVRVYLGPKPAHGIQIVGGSPKYLVPGNVIEMGTFELNMDASKSSYPGNFFLEISVSCPADQVSSETGTNASKELLRQAEEMAPEFQNIIDLVAGIVGLRLHRQFILEPLDENSFAFEGDKPFTTFNGPAWEMLENVVLTDYGIAQLEGFREALLEKPEEPRRKLGLIFHWLLRSWRERDPAYQFVALFLPLEAILNLPRVDADNNIKKKASLIRSMLKAHGGDQKDELLKLFNDVMSRHTPTLDERFVELAQAASLPGWEGDVEAFRRFKRLRNALVHRGDKQIQHRLSVGEDEVRTLSDLVERYVNWFVFRDQKVYQSRFRLSIKQEEGASLKR